MRSPVRTIACVAAVCVCAGVGRAASEGGRDAAWAKAFVQELIHPTPLEPKLLQRVETLMSNLGDDEWKVRERANEELLRIGAKAESLVRKGLKNPDLEIRIRTELVLDAYKASHQNRSGELVEAAQVLVAAKDKWILDCLVELLQHDDPDLRYVAEYSLRRFTGKQLGYNAHDDEPARSAAAKKWAAWWKDSREGFQFGPQALQRQVAGVVVCDITGREVLVIDAEGKTVWSKKLDKRPYAVDALDNGNILVASYDRGQSAIEEYDRQGKVVWKAEGLDLKGVVQEVRRLPNGNTLMTDPGGRRIIEVDPSGKKVVWQYTHPMGSFASAERIDNGNTLLCLHTGQVIEVSKAGKTVWIKENLNSPRDAQKLDNGNVLITEYGRQRLVEVNPSGKEVWDWTNPGDQPVSACRLPDGRTVVHVRLKGLLLVDRSGKVLKTLLQNRPRSFEKIRLAPGVVQAPDASKGKEQK